MVKTFDLLTLGVVDSQSEMFMPGCCKMPQRTIKILDNFDNSKVIGRVESIEEKDGKIICTGNMMIDPKGLIPAIGYKPIRFEEKDGVKVMHEIDMFCVGLSRSPNIDDTIKPF
jgi:hypothetical protein